MVFLYLILILSMLPQMAIIGNIFLMYKKLGFLDQHHGLIIAYDAVFMPFSVWFLASFLRTVPDSIEEAALLDGAGELTIIFRIMLPLSISAITTLILLVFITTWNEFLFAFTFTTSNTVRTVPVALLMMREEYAVPWGKLSTGASMTSIPIVILALLFQKYIIKGLTAGAVKS